MVNALNALSMKKLLSLFTLVFLLTGCASTATPSPEASQQAPQEASQRSETEQRLTELIADGDPMRECTLEWEVSWVNPEVAGFLPEQMTRCYEIFDVTLGLVSVPNANWALEETRAWEAEGNTAWSGLVLRRTGGAHEVFFKIPDEDFNPVALYLTEESLILDTADDFGAGSGEGVLQRYEYPFAGVADELLYTWQKEKCTSAYIPESYSYETVACR